MAQFATEVKPRISEILESDQLMSFFYLIYHLKDKIVYS